MAHQVWVSKEYNYMCQVKYLTKEKSNSDLASAEQCYEAWKEGWFSTKIDTCYILWSTTQNVLDIDFRWEVEFWEIMVSWFPFC